MTVVHSQGPSAAAFPQHAYGPYYIKSMQIKIIKVLPSDSTRRWPSHAIMPFVVYFAVRAALVSKKPSRGAAFTVLDVSFTMEQWP